MASRPQAYDWAHMNNGFTARIVLPFFSAKYKTDMTMHCILKAFEDSLIPEDELQLQSEEEAALHEIPNNNNWRAPAIKRNFDLHTFFTLYRVHLRRAAPLLFHFLRNEIYGIPEEHYQHEICKPLRPVDALGLSGSIFFFTDDRSFIVKSVGRKFEYTFLYEHMMDSFADYYLHNPHNLLTQITDVLYSFDHRVGSYLGLSPSHYVVMANVLEGLDEKNGCRKWDLKPRDFFEPTRDLIPDAMKSEQTKSGLADELDEQMVLSKKRKEELMALLRKDTEFLEKMETIDYSLLLGRYPIEMFRSTPDPSKPRNPLVLQEDQEDFVRGVISGDGKWVYKMCLLDFLWNVNQLQPKIMKIAGKTMPEQTITTEPGRYRKEFLRMMDEYIDVIDED